MSARADWPPRQFSAKSAGPARADPLSTRHLRFSATGSADQLELAHSALNLEKDRKGPKGQNKPIWQFLNKIRVGIGFLGTGNSNLGLKLSKNKVKGGKIKF